MVPSGPVDTRKSPYAHLRTLPFEDIRITSGLLAERQKINRQKSLAYGYEMFEKGGNFENLRLAGGVGGGKFDMRLASDSDVYKWLEALAYELARQQDGKLQRMADDAISMIASAQDDDGYLMSYFQVLKPEKRWTDLKDGHELYCAGHLFQAAVAYARIDDNRLMEVSSKLLGHICSIFGPDKREGTGGHPEIELALVELYRQTEDKRWLELAKFFIDERGRRPFSHIGRDQTHYQNHLPIREQRKMEGHAVRQLYLTSGITDLYLETGEQKLLDVLLAQWDDMLGGKVFITGGVGQRYQGETFGLPYELPSDRCYCETCAQIASIMWNWRMLLVTGESRFADVIERTLFNGFLSGVSLDGKHFFYMNPLSSQGGYERPEWQGTACCPPNVMRLLASLDNYIATTNEDGLQIHQFIPAKIKTELANGQNVELEIETEYPWQGKIAITINQSSDSMFTVSLRKPDWCEQFEICVNGRAEVCDVDAKGYLSIERVWKKGDTIELNLNLTPMLIEPNPRIDSVRGSYAIQCGAIVYCLEQCDQPEDVNLLDVKLDVSSEMRENWDTELAGGVMTVELQGFAEDITPWHNRLYRVKQSQGNKLRKVPLKAVPYFSWANRGAGAMRVWIPH